MKEKIQKQVLTKEKNTKLETKPTRVGLPLKPEEYILFQWILTAFLGGVFYLITDNWLLILLGGSIGFVLPKWFLRKEQRERVTKFNEGFADMVNPA